MLDFFEQKKKKKSTLSLLVRAHPYLMYQADLRGMCTMLFTLSADKIILGYSVHNLHLNAWALQ